MNDKYEFDLASFGARLKEIRNFYGYTQQYVADEIGVADVKSLQNWENGKQMPTIDSIVNLSQFYHMSVGELLEDEPYRIWNKKKDCRKRSIEIIEVPDKIETYFEITEDRYFDRYEVWVFDEVAKQKLMWMSVQKLISFDEIRETIINQREEIVEEYREWLLSILSDSEEDISIKERLLGKISAEKAGMAAPGCVCIGGLEGKVFYFGSDADFEDEIDD